MIKLLIKHNIPNLYNVSINLEYDTLNKVYIVCMETNGDKFEISTTKKRHDAEIAKGVAIATAIIIAQKFGISIN